MTKKQTLELTWIGKENRPALPPARGSHRRSLLHHAGRPGQGTQGDHEAMGQARRADRTGDGRDGRDVWGFAGDCGEIVAGDSGAGISCFGKSKRRVIRAV